MRRILLVANGTLDRPLRNIAFMVAGLTVTFVLGLAIIRADLALAPKLLALVALLVGVAFIMGRFGGPREIRLEKPADGGALRLTGRFVDGEIPSAKPRELKRASLGEEGLAFDVGAEQSVDARFHLRRPAFSNSSLQVLHAAIQELRTADAQEVQHWGKARRDGIKVYDAKGLLLLRFSQRPSYLAIMWLVAAVTLLALLLLAVILGT